MWQKTVFDSENQKIKFLIKFVAAFWFLTKLWSYKTWIIEREYPVIPPFDFLKQVPADFHLTLFCLSLINLLLVVFFRRKKWMLISLFLLEFFSCALDTVRWQPWQYMYMCMLLLIILNFSKPKNIVFLFHLFLVGMYLFSGLHKLNRDFLYTFWMNTVLQEFFGLSLKNILKFKLFFFGLLIPVIEIGLAVLLLVVKSKRIISYFLIAIHISILIIIGPAGLGYNSVVWFWNLALIFILLILYTSPVKYIGTKLMLKQFYCVVLWFLMPVLSFFGLWYQYFSFNLYSGKGYQMYVCVNKNVDGLKPYLEPVLGRFCKDKPYFILQNWAMAEIKSAPLPEFEIYKKISNEIKKKYGDKSVRVFLYNTRTKKTEEL
ncbi:hypothetical protein AR685_16075 [Chryseobacterium sp. JAH]|nr:hypothetical protein AR685_16075 [Chryseobacterium sp. JAH]